MKNLSKFSAFDQICSQWLRNRKANLELKILQSKASVSTGTYRVEVILNLPVHIRTEKEIMITF